MYPLLLLCLWKFNSASNLLSNSYPAEWRSHFYPSHKIIILVHFFVAGCIKNSVWYITGKNRLSEKENFPKHPFRTMKTFPATPENTLPPSKAYSAISTGGQTSIRMNFGYGSASEIVGCFDTSLLGLVSW